jgi:hypothetical protein
LLTAYLNMADQTASTMFDVDQVKANLVTINHKKVFSPQLATTPVTANPSVHLAFYEISLLFGGHCMLSNPESSRSATSYKDGETKDNLVKDNQKLVGKHKPGSFIIPLSTRSAT